MGSSEDVAVPAAPENNPPLDAAPPAFTFHRSFVNTEIKAVNVEKREVLHLISNATEDRAGDVVEPSGAVITNYLRNPVVLADHNYSIGSIIGRNEAVEITREGLWARTRFSKEGLGRDAFNLVREGFARAWSIGFRPIVYDSRKDEKGKAMRGFHFKEWELLEYSLVAIPMNPDAVMNCVRAGLIAQENSRLLITETVLDSGPVAVEAVEIPPAKSAAGQGPNAEPSRLTRDPRVVEALRKWAAGMATGASLKRLGR